MNAIIYTTNTGSTERYARLKLSFQFHHTQMDGAHAGRFLERLQENINWINTL